MNASDAARGGVPDPGGRGASSAIGFFRAIYPGPSGPLVAAAFIRLYALIVIIAWLSLAVQVRVLIGSHGLLPLDLFLAEVRAPGALPDGLPILGYPSLLRWPLLAQDGVLLAGCLFGILLGALAFFGRWPRICFALSTFLYLGYVTASRTFLSFQWDNLLLECGLLASFLPRRRAAPLVHLLFRLLLFKLYAESGLAKWQSPLGDWRDGSAMTHYYETAPLPTCLGFYAHNLPVWWHHIESRAALVLELGFPFLIFLPVLSRPARRTAAAGFTLFQVIDAATANYGFFCHLSVAMNVFLLEDSDLRWAAAKLSSLTIVAKLRAWLSSLLAVVRARLGRRTRQISPSPMTDAFTPASRSRRRGLNLIGVCAALTYVALSALEAWDQFGPSDADAGEGPFAPLQRLYSPMRLINTYHLFASVTRERIEPEIEIHAGGAWSTHDLRWKPGDPRRAPPFVAPHQPRVDFQLWFHGLSPQRQPAYLGSLLQALCDAPSTVQSLFAAPLPVRPSAVRMGYQRYRFETLAGHRATGAFWTRTPVGTGVQVSCDR